VVAQLTKLPVIVLNSHTHHDHVGGNYAFTRIYGVDSAFTRANAAQGYSNAAMASQVDENSVCPPLPDGVTPATYLVKPFHITKFIHDKQVIDLGGRRLLVIFTPGHTPDSLCLLDPAQREMFTGDTYYPGSLWLWAPETDLDAYQHSIETLAAMAPRVDVLRPAHGSLEGDPQMLAVVAKTIPDIRAGKIPYTVRNGRRIYRADGFSVAIANRQ
jgi:glyoxylase-like metal-dependent hydrolase (beta-lactamase superfamily II)